MGLFSRKSDTDQKRAYLNYYGLASKGDAPEKTLTYAQWSEAKKKKPVRDLLKPIGRKKAEDTLEEEFNKLRGASSVSQADKDEILKRMRKHQER